MPLKLVTFRLSEETIKAIRRFQEDNKIKSIDRTLMYLLEEWKRLRDELALRPKISFERAPLEMPKPISQPRTYSPFAKFRQKPQITREIF